MSKFPVVSLRARAYNSGFFPIKFERDTAHGRITQSQKIDLPLIYVYNVRANDIVETRSRRGTQKSIRIPRGAKKRMHLS